MRNKQYTMKEQTKNKQRTNKEQTKNNKGIWTEQGFDKECIKEWEKDKETKYIKQKLNQY